MPVDETLSRYSDWTYAAAVGVYVLALGPFMLLDACIRWIVLPPWDAMLETYVPRAGHSPLEFISSGFADQITIYSVSYTPMTPPTERASGSVVGCGRVKKKKGDVVEGGA